MKHKAKRFKEGGGYGRFTEEKLDVEGMKEGMFAGAPSDEPEVRSYSTTGPESEKKKVKPKVKAAPKAESKAEAKPEAKAGKYDDLPLNRIGRAIEGTFRGRREEEPAKAETKPEPKSDKYSDAPLNRIGRAIAGTFSKGNKAGGAIKMASGGKVSSASSRGDGIAQRGKTRGRMC